MRALVIDEEARAKVAKVVKFAEHHVYWPLYSRDAPGAMPEHVAQLNSFRCVFSITADKFGDTYRHLTISVPSKDYPNPVAVAEIAGLFGFTGWEEGVEARAKAGAWMGKVNVQEHCIVLAEKVAVPVATVAAQ